MKVLNKRGEIITLKQLPIGEGCSFVDEKNYYYNKAGQCYFWSIAHERFFMNTDPNSDLVEPPTFVAQPTAPIEIEMSDEERLEKLELAISLIREVEFSYHVDDSRRKNIFHIFCTTDWVIGMSMLIERLKKSVRGY